MQLDVIEWLSDSDPAVRWQVMRDLTDAPTSAVGAERSRMTTEGWAARLLSLQDAEGRWGREVLPANIEGLPDADTRKLLRELHRVSIEDLANYLEMDPVSLAGWESGDLDPLADEAAPYRSVIEWMKNAIGTFRPAWTSTYHTLTLLRLMGLEPDTPRARSAVALVRKNAKWDHDGQDFFAGEVEPCINGTTVAIGAYFGENVDGIVDRLLEESLPDGGWNCEAERGSIRSSFHTTIAVVDGLLEYERAGGAKAEVTAARVAGEEYLLERGLLRRLSTGELVDPDFSRFSFPPRWHYDVLRGLDYFRTAHGDPDERCAEAIDLVVTKRGEDGRWLLENTYPGLVHFDMDDGDGRPSRWNTLRAMRVLRWAGVETT
jgi:hypothetical protein